MELTASQGCIMGYLYHRQQPACAKDIEEAFEMSHSCVSGLLSRLEKKGFLALRPDEQDRRCKRIYILPKGRACYSHMRETLQSIDDRIVQGFTPEEQAQFSRLLYQAVVNMGGNPICPHKEE